MIHARMLMMYLALVATAGCTTYSQAVVDTDYDLVYVTYTKNFMGMTTRSGVLACVPTDRSLQCVDRIVVGPTIPCTREMSETTFGCSSGGMSTSRESSTSTSRKTSTGWAATDAPSAARPSPDANVPQPPAPIQDGAIQFGNKEPGALASALDGWTGRKVQVRLTNGKTVKGKFTGSDLSTTIPGPSVRIFTASGVETPTFKDIEWVSLDTSGD